MYLFKTSGATFESVIHNQKHAFKGSPRQWSAGEVVLVSKNREDCRPGEAQIQYVMRLDNIRLIQPGEAERYWPGNEGRWRYIVECSQTERINTPFDLRDVLHDEAAPYQAVMTFKKLDPEHEQRILDYLAGMGVLQHTQQIDQLRREIRDFVDERDWAQFHTPKDLSMGLSIEAAELMELFLWKSEKDSWELTPGDIIRVREELGDVMIFLTNLADKFGLDPIQCAREKLQVNRQKYPADQVRGSSRKYDFYTGSAPNVTGPVESVEN